jgi:hypothetical protein
MVQALMLKVRDVRPKAEDFANLLLMLMQCSDRIPAVEEALRGDDGARKNSYSSTPKPQPIFIFILVSKDSPRHGHVTIGLNPLFFPNPSQPKK